MNTIEGHLSAKRRKFGIVVSRFNEFISSKLLAGAIDCLGRYECDERDIDVAWVPGAFEIPLVAKKMAKKATYDGIICLGAVIRGQTPHFDYVCSEAAKGISAVSLETEIPIVFGILTTDNLAQAIKRSQANADNKGHQAAAAAIEMANILRKLD